MNRILVVEDDGNLQLLYRSVLERAGFSVITAANGEEALQRLENYQIELIITDIMMPGMDGFQVLEKIRETNRLPVLMLTAKSDSTSKVIGLRSGADDYLAKPFDMDEFIARVHSLIRRYTNFNSLHEPIETLTFKELTIDLESRSVLTKNGTPELPPKEFDILVYCAQNQGKILTKQQIFEKVWQEPYVYDDNNIMAIISKLRKKIEDNPSSPTYIQTVKGIGYRFSKDV